jgi:hypothetical protein
MLISFNCLIISKIVLLFNTSFFYTGFFTVLSGMILAESIIKLKNDEALVLSVRDAVALIVHIAEYETINVRVHVNYERGKIKLVKIP